VIAWSLPATEILALAREFLPPPEMPPPVSVEWLAAQTLQMVEATRFDPARLASYTRRGGDAAFLDFVIERLGGRSQ
jgi:hypothetical protein